MNEKNEFGHASKAKALDSNLWTPTFGLQNLDSKMKKLWIPTKLKLWTPK
jgi:hypothetical protein